MLGFKGPRKMTIIIPGMTHDQKRVKIIPQDNTDSILGNGKLNFDACLLLELFSSTRLPKRGQEIFLRFFFYSSCVSFYCRAIVCFIMRSIESLLYGFR